MIRPKVKTVTAVLTCVLLCMLFVLPVGAFTSYEGVPGEPLRLPYPEFYGALTVSSVNITMDIGAFAEKQMDAQDFFAYGACATAEICFYNTGVRPQDITMRWDIGQLPYYLMGIADADVLSDFLALHTVQVDGEQVTPRVHYSADGAWVEYLTYPLHVEVGGYVTTTVKCPLYPSILDQYDPAVYTYGISFGELRGTDALQINVQTPYRIAKGMPFSDDFPLSGKFKRADGGYTYTEQEPIGYYTVALSTRTRQMDGDRLFWNLLPVIILAVPMLLALGAVAVIVAVIILIVRLVKAQKRKQSANAHKTE